MNYIYMNYIYFSLSKIQKKIRKNQYCLMILLVFQIFKLFSELIIKTRNLYYKI